MHHTFRPFIIYVETQYTHTALTYSVSQRSVKKKKKALKKYRCVYNKKKTEKGRHTMWEN